MIGHNDWKKCPVRGLTFWLFYLWHLCRPAQEESDQPFHIFKKEDWYRIKLFPHNYKDFEKQLSYKKHLSLINSSYGDANISSAKKTHAPRGSGARAAELSGASEEKIARLGRWGTSSISSHLARSYLTNLPIEALLCQAGFPLEKDSYFLARSSLQPPQSLTKKIFPWADALLSECLELNLRLKEREQATINYLKAIIRLRVVFLQDFALLHQYTEGKHILCVHWIAQDEEFLDFKRRLILRENQSREVGNVEIDHARHIQPFGDVDPEQSQRPTPTPYTLASSEVAAEVRSFKASLLTYDEKIERLENKIDQLIDIRNVGHLPRTSEDGGSNLRPLHVISSDQVSDEVVRKGKKHKLNEYAVLTKNLTTIDAIYKEYAEGLMGRKSVKELEKEFKDNKVVWWSNPNERKTYFKRVSLCEVIGKSLEGCNDLKKVLTFWKHCCQKYFKGSVLTFSYALADSTKNPACKERGQNVVDPGIKKCWEEFEAMVLMS